MNEARDISKPMMNDANPANWKIGWVSVSALLGSLLTSPIGWLKNALVFHPNTEVRTSPAEYGMPYEDVWFGGSDGRLLHGWYVPSRQTPTGATDPLFIWFHGNAGNVGHRLAHLRFLRDRVGHLGNRPIREALQKVIDRAQPRIFGKDCMVEGWPDRAN